MDTPRSLRSIAVFLACCVIHAESGLDVTPASTTPPAAELDEEQHIQRLERIVSTVKKSHATIASACARRNGVQVGP